MAASRAPSAVTLSTVMGYVRQILGPEKSYYGLALTYGILISLLSVATPVAVQTLINNVISSGLLTPLVVLTIALLALLLLSVALRAMRMHLVDVFKRKFYARMVAEIAVRTIYARDPNFDDRNESALFNRYFDIMVIMRRVPDVLVGGFTIVLQAVAGFVLVSFYHPFLLLMSLVIIGLTTAVWAIWGSAGILTGVELSHRKHLAAAWLESLGHASGFYKREHDIAAALAETDRVTERYMEQHVLHFRMYFSQIIALLVIYALGSAALLGLGGWLVINDQLSIGQLVAAELVLSTVLVGISQLGTYLSYIYDITASADELALFFKDDPEPPKKLRDRLPELSPLEMLSVKHEGDGISLDLNMRLEPGDIVYAYSASSGAQRHFEDLLRGTRDPQAGYIALGGQDLKTVASMDVRQEIMILDRSNVLDSSIRYYLTMSACKPDPDLMWAIRLVGLESTILELPDVLDTKLASSGWPLTATESMQLKLACALLAEPQVVVLGQVYDALPPKVLADAQAAFKAGNTIVIRFTHLTDQPDGDRFLYLEQSRQLLFDSWADLQSEVSMPLTAESLTFAASEPARPLAGAADDA
ncbi:MAG: ABC transporter ATP-binding protein [Halieaceae bacterium]|nr:ABC transporter ATP-binding protein [Halieaceae bacterium]